jgi:hypothetical protein
MKQFIAWIEYIPGEQVHGQRFIESGSSGRNIQGFIHSSVIQHEFFFLKKKRIPMLALLLVNNYRKQEGMRLLL